MGLASNITRQVNAMQEDGVHTFQAGGSNTDLSGDYTTMERATDAAENYSGYILAALAGAVALVVVGGDD